MASSRTRAIAVASLAAVLAACLPDGTRPRNGIPTLDDTGSDEFVSLSVGREHACALTADGTAWCWGSNEFGQLGVSDDGPTCTRGDREIPCRPTAVTVNTQLKFRRISAGGVHTCGIATDDRIHCWGDNLRGGLGDPLLRVSRTPAPVATTALFADVATGEQHSCGVRLDGVVMCWGSNDWGQIGVNSSTASFGAPVTIGGPVRYASISAAGERTCGRALDGTAFCWGRSWAGAAGGAAGVRAQLNPARVQGSQVFRSLQAGVNTTCGVTLDHEAFCWEANILGTLGNGTLAGSLSPQPVGGDIVFVSVRSGSVQTCGLDDAGFAWCWGGGSRGELGVSPLLLRQQCGEDRDPCALLPIRVSGWRQFSDISAGQGNHGCALTIAGNVYCWGAGDMGQRGDGRTSFGEWSPVKVNRAPSL